MKPGCDPRYPGVVQRRFADETERPAALEYARRAAGAALSWVNRYRRFAPIRACRRWKTPRLAALRRPFRGLRQRPMHRPEPRAEISAAGRPAGRNRRLAQSSRQSTRSSEPPCRGDPERRRDQRKPEAPEKVKQSWQSCVAQMERRTLPRSARASVIKDAASGEWRQESQDCQTEPKRKRPGEACGPRRRGRPAQADAVQPTSLFEGTR